MNKIEVKTQDFWNPIQSIIESKCNEFDKIWRKRKRIINTQLLVLFILKLVMSKNKQGYASVLSELWENNKFSALKQDPVSASSICDARQKMPAIIFTELNQDILHLREKTAPLPLWYGHRVFGVDGSKINLPRKLLTEGYKAPNRDQYYPQGLFSTLYHLGSSLIYDGILTADRSELAHMACLKVGDVIVLDRGYFSYLVVEEAIRKGLHLICRMQNGNVNKEVKGFYNSESVDEIITYQPSLAVKYASEKQGYNIELTPIKLRLIKYVINDETYVCCKTLFDEQYTISELSKVYHGRWGIEELYKISKEFVDIEDFHSQSELGVQQECLAHILMINIARIFEFEASKELPVLPLNTHSNAPQDNYWKDFCGGIQKIKINFNNCLLVLGRSLEQLLFPVGKIETNWISQLIKKFLVFARKYAEDGM